MRRSRWVLGITALGVIAVVVWANTASAITTGQKFHLHERHTGTSITFIDLGAKGPSFGDEVMGTAVLTDVNGARVGSDSFVCTSVAADGATFQCTTVYDLTGGRVTAQGQATIGRTHPLFDQLFAVTGGTKSYQNVRGQVRIVQNSLTNAELYFSLLP